FTGATARGRRVEPRAARIFCRRRAHDEAPACTGTAFAWKTRWSAVSPAPRAPRATWTSAFVQRLRALGWIESRTIAIEYRWAEGRDERYRIGDRRYRREGTRINSHGSTRKARANWPRTVTLAETAPRSIEPR